MTKATPEIVCKLTDLEFRERKELIRRELTPFMTKLARADKTLRLEFSEPEVTVQMLEELIELERECCPFLDFRIIETDCCLELIVAGPVGSEGLVNDLFAVDSNGGACC